MPGGGKTGQSGGPNFFFFFFPNFIFYKLESTGGGEEKLFFLKDEKKKFYPQFLDPVGRWTGNAFLFEAGPIDSCIASSFSQQIANGNAGYASPLQSTVISKEY